MARTDSWSLEVSMREEDRETRAEARLTAGGPGLVGPGLVGHGLARRNPDDQEVTQIGAEIAAARALSDLSHQMLNYATTQIEDMTHKRAHVQL